MKKPVYINIQDYNYTLPEERIAKFPLESRDESKLLYYNHGTIESKVFRELPEILSDQHHLVFNDTRVILARLQFHKATGSPIEIFLLEPWLPWEYSLSFSSKTECTWKCLVGNAKKWKTGILTKEVSVEGASLILNAEMAGREGNYFHIRFSWNDRSLVFSQVLEHAGSIPIPPYLNREAVESDNIRYQTVYSLNEGSVAAPTAGLHFTQAVMKRLEKSGVSLTRLTLHVGAGTFIPVKEENAIDHEMHTEHIYLSRPALESLYASTKKLIAVGTTSVRTLESLYHTAVKLKMGFTSDTGLFLEQWEAYDLDSDISRNEVFSILLAHMDRTKAETLKLSTRIMIAPGYSFRMVDGIITNFHQPSSTLLLLISAFTGENWRKIYSYALENEYRFLSYGDSSLLLK